MKSSNIFQVERILNKRARNNVIEYQIKWKGYPLKESTWEPLKHLAGALDEVNDFEAKQYKASKEKRRRSRSKEKFQTVDSEEEESETGVESDEKESESNIQEDQQVDEKYVKILDWKKDHKSKRTKVQVQKKGRKKQICWVEERELQKSAPTLLCNFLLQHMKIK